MDIKKGTRVKTRHGLGTVMCTEKTLSTLRYGIKHDQFPESMECLKHKIDNETLYFTFNNLQILEQ